LANQAVILVEGSLHGEASMNRRHFLNIPAHCTGLNTIIAVHREMPGKLVMPSTGTRVIFGA
jgi:metal-dependent hydrolase (beta-lactamase superfamily II)